MARPEITGRKLKTADDDEQFGIDPYRFYRRYDPIVRAIFGLADSTIDEEIAKGTIPAPAPLTACGRSKGWVGATLIKIIRERLAKAAEVPMKPPRIKKKRIGRPPKDKGQRS